MADLKNKFLVGMEEQHGILEADFPNWSYAGGDHFPRDRELLPRDRHARTFEMLFPGREYPEHTSSCPCGQTVHYNCYIKPKNEKFDHDTRLVAVGSCCVEKFMGESCTRKCAQCGGHNARRTSAKCKACTDVYCSRINCRTKRYKSNELCYCCKYPGNGSCKDCKRPVKGNYQRCYTCSQKFFNKLR